MATTFLLAGRAFGAVTITSATGGTSISADKSANASTPAWTTLGPIVIAERNKPDFGAGSGVTLVLKAPAGFEFNTSAPPNVTFASGQDITSASISFSNSSTMAITLNVGGTSGTDQLTIGNTTGLQVRPTAGTPPASGQIFRPQSAGGTASVNGISTSSNADGSGGSNFGSLSEVVGSAAKLAFTTQPGGARTGAIFGTQPVVKTQDQFGNNSVTGLGSSVNVSIALTSGTGPLLGATALNIGTAGGNGTVTYINLEIDSGGTNKQLTASAPGLTSALSSVFTVNSPPTISSISNVTTNEDTAVTVPFTISDLETPADALVVSGTSSNSGLVPSTNIVFGGSGNARTVSLYPLTNAFGSSTITIQVSDGSLSSSNSFLLTLNAVNEPPTMNALTNRTILEDAAAQTVNLSGISPGPGNESTQTVAITATSDNPSLIPNPTVNYSSPSSTGTLTFAPLTSQFGTATITVVVKDNGGTANGGIDSLTNSFSITVSPVNDPPTLNPLGNLTVNVNSGPQNVALSGITPGPSNESAQTLTISATSSNPNVIPNPVVNYTNGSSTGALVFNPAANASGSATITVTVRDNGGTANGGQDTITRQFLVTVTELSDVAVSQTAIPSPGFLGGTVIFKVTVTNLGPTTATGIQVTNTLPAGIGSFSVTASQGSSSTYGNVVVASLGSLTNGGVATLNVSVEPLAIGSYTNFASVSSSAPDPDLSNNSSSATDTVVPTQFVISGATLVSESCTNGGIDPGERVTLSFALQNLSSFSTTNLVATLKATGGVTAPGASQTYGALSPNGPAVSRSFSFTPVGDCNGTFVATFQLQDGSVGLGTVTTTLGFGALAPRTTSITNTAFISIPSSGPATPYPSAINVSGLNSNLLSVTVTLNRLTHTQPQDLSVLLVGPNGQKALLMSDCGGINVINGVILTFDNAAASGLPNQAQIVSGTFKPTDFPPDETVPLPAPTGPYLADLSAFTGTNPNGTWQLFVYDSTDPFSGNIAGGWTLNVTTPEPACCVDRNSIDAALAGISGAPNPVVVGNNVTFTILATNLGPATATGVTITNPIPANATFVSATSSQGNCSNTGGGVVCSLGTLVSGGSASMSVTLHTTQPGALVSSATISANEPEHALANNAASGSVIVAVPAITISDATVVEGNAGTTTNAVFTLQLSSASIQTISVNYSTTNITALAGSDFTPTNGLVVFNPGETTKTIAVTVLGDNINEATEFFGVVLTNPVNVTLGNNQGRGTITDDDPLPSLSISDASVVEGDAGTTNLLFTVTVTPVSGQFVSFNYATADGSAVAGSDYIATNGTLALQPGQSALAIAVPVIGDTLNESNETFFVNLSSVVNATLARSQAVGTIINDDFRASIVPSGATLTGESCAPANGVIDPNEAVTVSFALRNTSAGATSTTNLVATLLQLGGITAPGAAQSYGALTPGGTSVSRSFTFTANGTCGDTLIAVLQLQDGASNLGTVTNFLTMGKFGGATNTFANSASLAIPDSGPASLYPSTINVSGLAGNITRMTAKLTGLSHTYPSDIQMLLVGPGRQSVLLMSDAGDGMPISNVTLTFDDGAASSLPQSTQIASGTYKPTDYPPDEPFPSPAPSGPYGTSLAAFNGLNPNGTWSLYVNDSSVGDSGSISGGWSLAFSTPGTPVCCGRNSAADLAVGMNATNFLVAGSNLTYTISVTNLGPDTASDVVLIDSLPAGVSFVSATTSLGSWSNNDGAGIVFNLGTMANSGRATLTVTGAAISIGTITNTVMLSARTGDPNPANSTASTVATVLPPYKLTVSPTNLSFGLFIVGQTSTQPFQIINGGGLTMTGSVSVPAPFSVQSGAFSVPGLQTGQVMVSFSPTTDGGFTNDVNFISNGGNSTNRVTGSAAFVPVAGFSAGPTSGSWPLTVSFINNSTGTITDVFWDFGDGVTTNTSSPTLSHTYAVPSTNTVSLTATGPVGTDTMTRTAYIVVTNLPPKLVVSPTNLDFGPVIIGQSLTQQFQVFNPGQLVLTGSVAVASPFGIVGASSFSVGGGQTSQVAVTFSPPIRGSYSNIFSFLSNGGNSSNAVSGNGLTPARLDVQPATLDLGVVVMGSAAQASFALTNMGDVTASNVVASLDSGPFSVLTASPFDLPGHGITNVFVEFAPGAAGFFSNNMVILTANTGSYTNGVTGTGAAVPQPSFSASPLTGFWPLTVNFSDSSTGTITNRFWNFGDGTTTNTSSSSLTHRYSGPGTNAVSLTATGPAGASTMTRADYILVTNLPPNLVVSPTNLSFGPAVVGQSSTQSFQVVNSGQLVLTGSVTAAAPFGIAGGSPFVVNPGQTGQVQVSFSPTQPGTFNGNAVITSSGGNSTNTLTGLALASPQIDVRPTGLAFGVVPVGTAKQASVTVTNLGDSVASNAVVSVSGGPFAILSSSSFNLPAHGSTNVLVQFAPTTESVSSNYLSIVTANAGSLSAPLTGIGTIPLVASFVGSPTAGAAPLTVNFTDNSTGTITNRHWSFGDGSTTNTTATNVAHTYPVGGNYSVSLTVSGARDTNTLTRANYISATDVAPSASFVGVPTSGSAPLGVQFTDTSTGTVTNRLWDFGDGSTTNTTLAQVLHFYNAGTYRVKLTVTGPAGSNFKQRNNYISVTNAPARLLVTPPNQNFGAVATGRTNTLPFRVINLGSFSLTGSVATTLPFSITSGNPFTLVGGQTGSVLVALSPPLTVAYSNNVIFTSGAGNSTNAVTGRGVTPPQLAVSPSTLDFGTVLVGSTVQASFVLTNSGGAPLTNGVATVGAGPFSMVSGTPFTLPPAGSTNLVVRFSPINSGSSSNAIIFVSDGGNRTNSVTGVGVVPLVANFSASPAQGLNPLLVSFTDTSTGDITNRFWNFGDGSTANIASTDFTHTYLDEGSFSVTLTISGPLGVNTLSRADYIVVRGQLLVTDIQVAGPDVVISFTSSPNQSYQLEYNDTLAPANWTTAVSPIPGDGGTVTVTHPGGAGSSFRFYRIRQLP